LTKIGLIIITIEALFFKEVVMKKRLGMIASILAFIVLILLIALIETLPFILTLFETIKQGFGY